MAASKFGKAFASARKSGAKEFNFGGKKYNTKLKEGGTKKSSLPKSTTALPKPRPSMTSSGKAVRPLQDRTNSGVAEKYGSSANIPSQGGPSSRGKFSTKDRVGVASEKPMGSDVRKSKAYITNNSTSSKGTVSKMLKGMKKGY